MKNFLPAFAFILMHFACAAQAADDYFGGIAVYSHADVFRPIAVSASFVAPAGLADAGLLQDFAPPRRIRIGYEYSPYLAVEGEYFRTGRLSLSAPSANPAFQVGRSSARGFGLDAVRTLRLARELLDGHCLVKLEVLGDAESLYPNMPDTLAAAKTLVAEGFQVMVYTSDDPIIAKHLEDIGCVAIMPLASLIGSGMGILNPWNLQLIMERVQVPVIVDAGVGTASDAAIAMELGCDGVLMNTAIAGAQKPVLMASAMKQAVEAGRSAYLAGRMPKKLYSASPSSPTSGIINPSRS